MRTGKEFYILGAISLVSNELNGFGGRYIKDLTFKQWFLLMMISKMEKGEKNVNDIADFAGTSRQNVKKMLLPLEKNGFVAVKKSSSDARALSVELTDKAYKFFYDNDGRIASATGALFKSFSESEIDALAASFKKLIACLESHAEK